MYFDIKDLIKFYYHTNLGKRTTLSLNRTLNHLFDCGKSEIVLGFGFTTPLIKSYVDNSIRTISLMPGLQGAMTWPESRNNINVLVEESSWPIETETVDAAILLHGLEMSLNPPKLLSEVWRVLKPNGIALIFVPNRAGFWARSDITPFGYGRPYSSNQLASLLFETKFEIDKSVFTMNSIPAENSRALNIPNTATYILNLANIHVFSGVIAVRASKAIFAPEKLKTNYFEFGSHKITRSGRFVGT